MNHVRDEPICLIFWRTHSWLICTRLFGEKPYFVKCVPKFLNICKSRMGSFKWSKVLTPCCYFYWIVGSFLLSRNKKEIHWMGTLDSLRFRELGVRKSSGKVLASWVAITAHYCSTLLTTLREWIYGQDEARDNIFCFWRTMLYHTNRILAKMLSNICLQYSFQYSLYSSIHPIKLVGSQPFRNPINTVKVLRVPSIFFSNFFTTYLQWIKFIQITVTKILIIEIFTFNFMKSLDYKRYYSLSKSKAQIYSHARM